MWLRCRDSARGLRGPAVTFERAIGSERRTAGLRLKVLDLWSAGADASALHVFLGGPGEVAERLESEWLGRGRFGQLRWEVWGMRFFAADRNVCPTQEVLE